MSQRKEFVQDSFIITKLPYTLVMNIIYVILSFLKGMLNMKTQWNLYTYQDFPLPLNLPI